MDHNIDLLVKILASMPGLGPKSARRIVLHLLKSKEQTMPKIIDLMQQIYTKIIKCQLCNNLDCNSPCYICSNKNRDSATICIVEDLTDLWAIEKSKIYQGKYHILGGALSAINGLTPQDLTIDTLLERIKQEKINEIIIATNSTIEGQTTGQYIAKIFRQTNVKTSFLAHGMPIGSEMDYLDEGTLNIAFANRKEA